MFLHISATHSLSLSHTHTHTDFHTRSLTHVLLLSRAQAEQSLHPNKMTGANKFFTEGGGNVSSLYMPYVARYQEIKHLIA